MSRESRRKAWEKRQQSLLAQKTALVAQHDSDIVSNPPRQPVKSYIAIFIGAGGTAVWIALASWSYAAAAVNDMIGAGILLVLAFFVAVGALMASERFGGPKRRLAINLSFAGALAVGSAILFWWEYSHRPMPLASADDVAKKVIEKLPQSTLPVPPSTGGTTGILLNNSPDYSINGVTMKGYDKGIDAKDSPNGKINDTLIDKG
jgi:hypothetical protein